MYGQSLLLVRLPTDFLLLGQVKAFSSWQVVDAERRMAPCTGSLVAGQGQPCKYYCLLHWHSAFPGVRLPSLCNPNIRLDPAHRPERCTLACIPSELCSV